MRRARLSADVVEYGTDIYVDIGHVGQHPAKPSQVVGVPSHVRGDEGRPRMPAEKIVAFLHELVEVRMLVRGYATSWKERQLEPSLVGVVDRLVELLRVSGVDEHWKLQASGSSPNRIEVRIVEREAGAVCLADRLPKALADFADADRPGGSVSLELRHRALRPSRPHVLKADPRERADSVLHVGRRIDRGYRPPERVARDIVCGNHQANVESVELRAELGE